MDVDSMQMSSAETRAEFGMGVSSERGDGHRVEQAWNAGSALANGSFGQVRSCSRLGYASECAIKIVDATSFQNFREKHNSTLSRLDEALVLGRLQHLNIVELLEYYDDARRLYLVFPLLGSGDMLNTMLHSGTLPQQVARRHCT